MDHRSKVIVSVGVAAILVSIGVFVVLYSGYEHRVTFVTDPDNLAQYFEIVDEETGETSKLEKGAKVYDNSIIRSNSSSIRWSGDPVVSTDSSTVTCTCGIDGDGRTQFILWVHGADILGAEMVDGALCVHVTDTIYNFAVSLSLSYPPEKSA